MQEFSVWVLEAGFTDYGGYYCYYTGLKGVRIFAYTKWQAFNDAKLVCAIQQLNVPDECLKIIKVN